MAVTVQAATLTEAHRLAQARLGALTVRQMFASWPLLDPVDLDGTLDRWMRIALALVRAQRSVSARLAANYLTTFRALELGVDVPGVAPVLADLLDQTAAVTSLTVTGPATVKRAIGNGLSLEQAMSLGQATSARAAMRQAMNGGRDTIQGTIAADPKALGWARAASGKACHFCAMLAGRGPVYSKETVDFHAHDGCSCTSEPVYHRDAAWPAGSQRYAALWSEATAGLSGADARNAFRQALAGQS